MFLGIVSGLLAGAFWGFVFLAPRLLTAYSAADIAMGRYAVFGAISALVLVLHRARLRRFLSGSLLLAAMGLSCLSFSVYYFVLSSSVKYSGVLPATLLSGLLPVTIPLVSHDRVARRGLFVASLVLIVIGLGVLNLPLLFDLQDVSVASVDWGAGFALAALAVAFWTAYAKLNARLLQRHPEIEASTWSSLLGVFAFLTMLPLWLVFGDGFAVASLTRYLDASYVLWMLMIGAGSSWIAIYLWNIASRRLPTALAGQLIVSEAVFSLLYNFVYEQRLPTCFEGSAAVLLILGVLLGIRSFKNVTAAPS